MPDSTTRIAGIRFRNAGKVFYFHAAGLRLEPGEYVVVESARGPELGKVVIAPDQVIVNELNLDDLKPILRLATDDDVHRHDSLEDRAHELLPEARRLAEDAGFPGRIDHAEFTLDGRRLTLSFASEERLDYRDFVRKVADHFNVRVDMRQVGARDRAKLAGGYGVCGRELCCSSWLTTFPAISIRMAKDQDLPLNPQKISGLCGRLLCCLSYEDEGYREMRKTLPKIGQRCSTPTGEGRVVAVNILRRQVTLFVDGQRVEVPDRDLGLVVRWDPTSKIGDPPPSISRADAIAQGIVEATEEDIREAELAANPPNDWLSAGTPVREEPGPGRGRLPGGGPRKEARPRPATVQGPQSRQQPRQPQPEQQGSGRPPQRKPGGETPPQQRGEDPAQGQQRVFQRRGQPPVQPSAPSPGIPPSGEPPVAGPGADGEPGRTSRRRRGRRGGRGRGTGGAPTPPSE